MLPIGAERSYSSSSSWSTAMKSGPATSSFQSKIVYPCWSMDTGKHAWLNFRPLSVETCSETCEPVNFEGSLSADA